MARAFGPSFGDIFFLILYVFALVLGVTVCGLYGQDLHHAQEKHAYTDTKWVFAVVVGAMSSITTAIYLIPLVLRMVGVISDMTNPLYKSATVLSAANIFCAIWDFCLFILWTSVFGVFGSMYIGTKSQGQSGIERMKNAVWVDLANMLLWLIVAIAAFGYWWKHRDPHSRFTGRAHV